MAARFVYRMDDITPGMDRAKAHRFLDLFERHGVVPLLGVVPDNRDPSLDVDRIDPGFWGDLRRRSGEGKVEIAQHGVHHLYVSSAYGVFGRAYGFRDRSEVAGLPYETQLDSIRAGRDVLRERGLPTRFWMSPSHTFDRATLRALAALGFEAVTDGVGLYPFAMDGVTLVPQQLWEPKRVPFGVWTICLHANTTDERLFDRVERHLESGARIVRFSDVAREGSGPIRVFANVAFRAAYRAHIARHRYLERRRRTAAS